MARTIVGLNDPKAVNRFSGALAVDVVRDSYFTSKFMSAGKDAPTPVQKLKDLETAAGHEISYDLSLQLKGRGVEGLSGEKLKDSEEDLKFATDSVFIDQKRHGVNAGTVMDRKRTLHDLREIARARLKDWWARWFDEQFFMYLCGARGINADYIEDTTYTGRANNAFSAPDADHIIYQSTATSKASLTAGMIMDLAILDKAVARATMMGGGSQNLPKIQPVKINGADHFVALVNPNDKYNMRRNATSNEWMDLQKNANSRGDKNPIFTGATGMYNNVIIHEHQAGIRFDDYGAGANVEASRIPFMGRQALVCAMGTPGGGMTFDWHEEADDRGNEVIIDTSAIMGVKKTTYTIDGTARDFGAIMLEVASTAP